LSTRKRQLKLGAVSHGVGGPGSPYLWLDEDFPVDASVNINWYIELARLAEEARFDLVFIVDSQFITADSPPHYLNRLEPLTLLSALAVSTKHIGLVATMTTSYNDIKGRAAAKGRNPDEIVIMPAVSVFVGDTDSQAREIERDLQTRDRNFDRALAELGRPFAWHDFRQYDLDAPFPQEALVYAERGFRTGAEKIAALAADNNFTLRQTVEFISSPRPTPFAGSPETVANLIQEWFEARALDGLNLLIDHPSQWRRFREDIVPILQDRGIVRTEYDSTTLRGNLGLPIPENRYAMAPAL
jgi:alkanesulfonate monooxygenase SsuD/methylene tetrahydromethanopterin reductase-like flavin-dependent oxidoreductase (luciferase family)